LVLGVIALAAVGWTVLGSHRGAESEGEGGKARSPSRLSTEHGQPVIKLDADAERQSGIKTAVLASASYQPQVRAYGMVLDLGPLTELSNRYIGARAQLQTAAAKLEASRTAYERAQKLYKDQQNVSLAELQAAAAAFRVDEAGVAAAQSQLGTLAATAYQDWGAVLGRALIDAAPMATRLIERQDFLIQVTLPPGVSLPSPSETAVVRTARDKISQMTLVSPATRTDPRIQGVSYFYTVPAASGVLPGMNVLALLPTGASSAGVAVPAHAVIWWQDRAWVWRRAAAGTYARLEIATDLPAPDGGYIVKDLPQDAEIVVRGGQLLLSEEFRAQINVGGD
jgi:hypothetical protein